MFSKALAERGLNFGDGTTANPPPRLMVEAPDWLVARASEGAPRSCLIWGDALEDTAVVRPRKARGQWVSLSALNNLRRLEPAKASKLWYDRYALDLRRLNAESGPAGVLLGGVMGDFLGDDSPAEAWFKAIAAGTFLYIATLDIVREEFFPGGSRRVIRLVAATAGAGIMALVAIWM